WGRMYLYALAFYLLAGIMKLAPEWAPVEFAVLYGISNVAAGLLLRRYAINPSARAQRQE
ncbi:MAG TPA: hypothetical protein VE988_09240, partial [Gemmataceae bacterium]|nr:hypothetical protein [Gemmataceae bacterium]